MGPRLDRLIGTYLRERPQRPGALDLEALSRGALPWLRGLPERFQEELEGLAAGAGLALQRVAEWSYVECCVDDGCSGFAGMLAGHAWVARNNDMFVPGIWGHATVRAIDGRIPTLCFGMEGDVFTATGVNERRLWLHHQALPASDEPDPGKPHVPSWVLLTEMLETCSTIPEVAARLDAVGRDDGMMLFAVDGKSDEIAVLECGRGAWTRRPAAGWLVGTNHRWGTGGSDAPGGSGSRCRRMEALAAGLSDGSAEPRLPDDLVALLADEGVERRGAAFATVYANVACPATGEVWFTFGDVPAASRGAWARVPWPW